MTINEDFINVGSGIGFERVLNLNGVNLYTNDNIKRQYLNCMKNSNRGDEILDVINFYMKKKKIIPCVINTSIKALIFSKLKLIVFKPKITDKIAGLYVREFRRLYIVFDSNMNIFTYANNDLIASVTVHEIVHLLAAENPIDFMNIFKSKIIEYYKHLFAIMFEIPFIEIDDKDIQDITLFLFAGESDPPFSINEFKNIMTNFFDKFSLDETKSGVILGTYLHMINLFLTDGNRFLNFINQNKKSRLLMPFYEAYKQAFGFKPINTLCFQEILYPSEIISVYSEYYNIIPEIKKIGI